MQDSIRKAFREDGAVLVKGVLSTEQLARCRVAFDWAVANPGPNAFRIFDGTEQQSHNDNANPLAKARLDELVCSLPLGRLFADLWGSEHAWYFAEEVFLKAGGRGSRTPWHQDTSYLPWAGMHWGNAWISFESVPKQNALEVVRGSHRGTLYDGTTFRDPNDPTQPLHGGGACLAFPTSRLSESSTHTPTMFSPGRPSPETWSWSIPARSTAARRSTQPSRSATPWSSVSSATTRPSARCLTTAMRVTRGMASSSSKRWRP